MRRGFILLFGTRSIVSNDASADTVNTVCPRCGQQAAIFGKTYRTWFTLFFIPVFPVSGAKKFSQCGNCGAQFPVHVGELAARVTQSDAAQNQRAIAMYNSMRQSPANSVTLNELMSLYASMGEYDQAISAAHEFAAARDNSEQCMTTLGRVYLAKNDFTNAIKWLEAAVARNPSSGESQYFLGVAHLTNQPPDLGKAVAAARAARAAGYPRADELLREAENRSRQ